MFNALAQQFKAEQPAQEAQQNNADMVARRKERRRERKGCGERERERNACALFLKSSSPFSLSWKTKSCISVQVWYNSSYNKSMFYASARFYLCYYANSSSSPFSLSWKAKSCISGRHNSSYKNLCSTPPRDSISAITLISVTTNLR